jgi:hypothetical protein
MNPLSPFMGLSFLIHMSINTVCKFSKSCVHFSYKKDHTNIKKI